MLKKLFTAIGNFVLPAPNEPPYKFKEKVPYKPGTEKALWTDKNNEWK